jgi:hypothetical protein
MGLPDACIEDIHLSTCIIPTMPRKPTAHTLGTPLHWCSPRFEQRGRGMADHARTHFRLIDEWDRLRQIRHPALHPGELRPFHGRHVNTETFTWL